MAEASAATTIDDAGQAVYSSGCACLSHAALAACGTHSVLLRTACGSEESICPLKLSTRATATKYLLSPGLQFLVNMVNTLSLPVRGIRLFTSGMLLAERVHISIAVTRIVYFALPGLPMGNTLRRAIQVVLCGSGTLLAVRS